jgi:ribonuclease HI
MRFKGESVWVRVDERGQLVLDADGRAEMKYRQEDMKSYRPASANLIKDPTAEGEAPVLLDDGGPVVDVWTDGACSGNPGPMGIGVVVLADGKRLERGEYLGIGTNNIAELTAIERGFELAEELVNTTTRPLRVHSDSSYALGLLGKGWKAKANQELVERLRQKMKAFSRVSLVKVSGHAGVTENERCDELARRAVSKRGNV